MIKQIFDEIAAEKIADMVDAVEKECPVVKVFALDVMNNNTAYCDETGKIWFEKSNGFENTFREQLKNIFSELRKNNPKGLNQWFFKYVDELVGL